MTLIIFNKVLELVEVHVRA